MKLLIVESPKKAKEIQHFLQNDFVVRATYGHFKDLPENELGVDLKTYHPKFVIIDTKHRQIFQEILDLASKSSEIYIATDLDREGYAIGYFLFEELKKKVKAKIYRVEFREITKQHILEQLKNPIPFEKTNAGLFNAFLGRRIGDRIVGYLLSPKHSRMNNASLSVGRVQSPAVRLVVDREIQIQSFKPTPYYVLSALLEKLEKDGIKFTAIYEKQKIDKETAENIYQDIKDEKQAKVEKVEKKQVKQSPKPPFTTSTLQQSANSVYRFPAERTMSLAQDLFESGLITYHRTDSTRISEQAITHIRDLIKNEFGEEYLPKTARTYKSKTQADAHEAIRITNFTNLEGQKRLIKEKGLTEDHFKLLKLIYERTVACQVEDAVFDKTDILLSIKGYKFKASGSVLKSKGWKVIFDENTEQQEETGGEEDSEENQNQKLPMINTGDIINIEKINNIQKFSKPPDRYTEGSLVRKLEELGIGRPSTYAGIMKTIKDRGYIKVEKGKVIPTEKGFLLIQSLNSNGDSYIIDYNFTKEMEEFLDKVEENKEDWKKFVSELFTKINFIPEKREVKPPSEKQVEFAKKLAEKHSVEIPEKAMQSSFEMKKFIDLLLQKKDQSVKTSRKDKKTPDSIRRR